jgi:hypothetical protein
VIEELLEIALGRADMKEVMWRHSHGDHVVTPRVYFAYLGFTLLMVF